MDGVTRATLLNLVLLGLGSTLACTPGTGGQADDETGKSYDEGEGLGEGECAGACGSPGCGECPAETVLVDGGGFMIDATEVRNGQYAALLEVDFDAAALPPGCEWKSGFEPEGWAEDLDPNLPVVGVDWCDAKVFCAWAGKRLCGAVGGGPGTFDHNDDPEADAWYRACSNAGANLFPYGPDYEPLRCNGNDADLGALTPVASMSDCEGGLPGLFDMSGNVWEWTDACETSGGDASTQCRRRGGSRHSKVDSLRCTAKNGRDRGLRDSAIGFRCCAG